MIGRAWGIGVVLLVGLSLVTACGSERPSELSMSEVKPCKLLSSSTARQLGVPSEPESVDSVPGVGMEGSTCFYHVRTGNTVKIGAITNHGIDWQIDGRFEHRGSKRVPNIQGYRTVKVWTAWNPGDRPGPKDTCTLFIDVSDEQSLRIEVGQTVDDDDPPTCETARRFAEAAMKTLITN